MKNKKIDEMLKEHKSELQLIRQKARNQPLSKGTQKLLESKMKKLQRIADGGYRLVGLDIGQNTGLDGVAWIKGEASKLIKLQASNLRTLKTITSRIGTDPRITEIYNKYRSSCVLYEQMMIELIEIINLLLVKFECGEAFLSLGETNCVGETSSPNINDEGPVSR